MRGADDDGSRRHAERPRDLSRRLIFLLADSTFAFACNSYNRNTVAQGCSIEYLAPAHRGDVLRATGVERSRSGRTGVYDIDVRNQDGRTVALFRGKSYRIDGHVVDETQIL